MTYTLSVNGRDYPVDGDADMPLLWAIRDLVGLKGTKFGCGVGLCGACTVHVDGEAMRSCQINLGDVGDGKVTTIEGVVAREGDRVPQAWITEQVPQCGYCQPGMIMAVTAMLKTIPNPTDEDIDKSITNICRCGTYFRIRKAIHRAAAAPASQGVKAPRTAGHG